jgi:hypothetical protein
MPGHPEGSQGRIAPAASQPGAEPGTPGPVRHRGWDGRA